MSNGLLIFGRLAHDAEGVLAAVDRLALVGVELLSDIKFHVGQTGLELSITAFADANRRGALLHDPQLTLLHDYSLAHGTGRM